MGKASIRVLHIDTEQGWRGGQQQAAYLLEAMWRRAYHTALVCQPDSLLEKFCRDKPLLYFPIKMRGELDFMAGLRIAKICQQHGFRLLHLHSAHALTIGLWARLFYRKLKLVAVRRVDFHINYNWLSRIKYRNSFLNKIICISNEIRKILLDDRVPADKLITIHSGIDIHKFKHVVPPQNFKEKVGIPEGHIVVGTIAAMVGHKDYPNLLKAARIVIAKNDHITFCAVGNGPDKEDILTLAMDLNLGKRFLFIGFQHDIGDLLKTFDIFVLSSKKEGLGTSILDAQAVGLPVIACRTGGIPEIVAHEENGLLVPPENERALADAILLMANNKELRHRLGQNARISIRAFDIRQTIEKNLRLYEEILA